MCAGDNQSFSDYRAPFAEGTTGIGLVIISSSSDKRYVPCALSGNPGPDTILWEREVESVVIR